MLPRGLLLVLDSPTWRSITSLVMLPHVGLLLLLMMLPVPAFPENCRRGTGTSPAGR